MAYGLRRPSMDFWEVLEVVQNDGLLPGIATLLTVAAHVRVRACNLYLCVYVYACTYIWSSSVAGPQLI